MGSPVTSVAQPARLAFVTGAAGVMGIRLVRGLVDARWRVPGDPLRVLLRVHGERRRFVSIPVPLCRALAFVLARVMRRPPLTPNAIAGIVNDANLDPSLAMLELGYRPIALADGLGRCFPRASLQPGPHGGLVSNPEGNKA